MMDSRTFLKGLLVKRLRISVKDGRVIDGHFMCTDKDCNIVLSNCEEFLTHEDVEKAERKKTKSTGGRDTEESVNVRTLGLAIVPGDSIVSINVEECCLNTDIVNYISTHDDKENSTVINTTSEEER